jgi:uncharacterized protein (TIGR03437 family)
MWDRLPLLPRRRQNGPLVIPISISVSMTTTPAIADNGVVNAASFAPGASPGSWISIFGSNLATIASPGRSWSAGEIIGDVLPTSLEGVSILIDGKPAAIAFVGPGQLNVQVPDDSYTGTVPVQVTTPTGTTQALTMLSPAAPALFIGLQVPGQKYAAAVNLDGVPVGDPTRTPGVRAVRPGDIILVFGTGFGETSPLSPAGHLVDAAPLSQPFVVSIGGVFAQALWGGIVGPGLYQFNIVVPNVDDGDQPILIETQSTKSQLGVSLPVRSAQ